MSNTSENIQHYYNDPMFEQGMFTYPSLYKSMVNRFSDESHFVEVGCWKGQSASFMAVEIHNSRKNIKFDCIDHWCDSWREGDSDPTTDDLESSDSLYQKFLSNTDRVRHIINPIRKTSIDAAKMYDDNSLDFVFIDGDHTYTGCKNDILAWLPKMKHGSVIAGHDYAWCSWVRNAVHEVFGNADGKYVDNYGVGYQSYDDPWKEGCWMVQVEID